MHVTTRFCRVLCPIGIFPSHYFHLFYLKCLLSGRKENISGVITFSPSGQCAGGNVLGYARFLIAVQSLLVQARVTTKRDLRFCLNNTVFWDVMPCSLVDRFQRNMQGLSEEFIPKMEAAHSS
jgi:hypothetical protein